MKKGNLNLRFWLVFIVSIVACGLVVFCAGFFLAKSHEIRLEESLYKKSVKLDNLSLLQSLNKKLIFLSEEAQKIQDQNNISSGSPFLTLVVFHQSKVQQIYKVDNLSVLNLEAQKDIEQRLVELSQQAIGQSSFSKFNFTYVKNFRKTPLVAFIKSDHLEQQWVAFLRSDKKIFQLPLSFSQGRDREAFVIDQTGRIFLHNKLGSIFKILSPDFPVLVSLEKPLKKDGFGGRYLKSSKKKKHRQIYYFQKWNQEDLFLVTRIGYSNPFFLLEDFYNIIWILICVAFVLFFTLFCAKTFLLVSSYKFLKMAFLSFFKAGVFPPTSSYNPLLYFYNNRHGLLSWRQAEEQEQDKQDVSLNFTEVIQQECKKLKSKFPNLFVEEKYEYDVKVFGFENFLRSLIREILLNGLEAMGGVKELKLDISLKEEEQNVVFSVRDYGEGVQGQDYKKVFRLYYSSKSQLGVGLNIVQSIVEANGGSLDLSSPEDGGLKISVCLPLKCFLKQHHASLGDH